MHCQLMLPRQKWSGRWESNPQNLHGLNVAPLPIFDHCPMVVRASLGASQSEFALMIGVSVATLQNWEQGRRTPDGPALALLRVAARNPKAVAEALHGKKRGAA
jgi:DNA-binding transcriptional regulator YdaS (Cro superfamily)